MESPKAVKYLITGLNDGDREVRYHCVMGLASDLSYPRPLPFCRDRRKIRYASRPVTSWQSTTLLVSEEDPGAIVRTLEEDESIAHVYLPNIV